MACIRWNLNLTVLDWPHLAFNWLLLDMKVPSADFISRLCSCSASAWRSFNTGNIPLMTGNNTILGFASPRGSIVDRSNRLNANIFISLTLAWPSDLPHTPGCRGWYIRHPRRFAPNWARTSRENEHIGRYERQRLVPKLNVSGHSVTSDDPKVGDLVLAHRWPQSQSSSTIVITSSSRVECFTSCLAKIKVKAWPRDQSSHTTSCHGLR